MFARLAARVPGWVRAVLAWSLFAGVLVIVWPSSLGGCTTLTTVTGHSMEPTLLAGDLAIVRCGTPREGDVVAYRPYPEQNALVIHRIVGGSAQEGWRLQGDNNGWVDVFTPTEAQVAGVMVASVPGVGGVVRAVSSPLVWATLLLLAAGLLLWIGAPDHDEPEEAGEIDSPADALPTQVGVVT